MASDVCEIDDELGKDQEGGTHLDGDTVLPSGGLRLLKTQFVRVHK